MYVKEYIKDNKHFTARYKSWYDVLFEGWGVSLVFLFTGLLGLFCSPFVAIWTLWKPMCVGSGVRHFKKPN